MNNCHLDYITATLDSEGMIPKEGEWQKGEDIGGSGLYKRIYRLKSGAIVRANDDGSKQGTAIIFSGKALENMRDATGGDREALNFVVDNARNISRIDFAVNFFDCGVNVGDFHHAFVSKGIETKARLGTLTQSFNKDGENLGETFYVGSRQSENFFRAYDKGKQMKMLGQAWLRTEMEWKGRRALGIASAMRERGIGRVGIANLLKFVAIDKIGEIGKELSDIREWNENDNVVTRRKETDFDEYLSQVYKAIRGKFNENQQSVIRFVEKLGDLLLERADLGQ